MVCMRNHMSYVWRRPVLLCKLRYLTQTWARQKGFHWCWLKITSMLGYGKSTLEIAKNMNRDHRTIERFAVSSQTTRKTPKICHLRRLSPRDIRKLKVEMAKTPHATSNSIFYNACAQKRVKTARYQTLKSLAKVMKPKNNLHYASGTKPKG